MATETVPTKQWGWSEGALSLWDQLDDEFKKLINLKAKEFLQLHNRDTVTTEDMKIIIHSVLIELANKQIL